MTQKFDELKTELIMPDKNGFRRASELLSAGETVAFPTETVYGLGGNALQEQAVEKIFFAKGRPVDNPLIIHIWSLEQLPLLASEINENAKRLMDVFWPGPLTLIFPKTPAVPLKTTGGLQTVAVRMPDHPVAFELLKTCNLPLAAPSANQSGRPSPTAAEHVWEDLQGKIAGVIDGGNCTVGVESTVLDLTADPPAILRPGVITADEISRVLQQEVRSGKTVHTVQDETVKSAEKFIPKAPGMKYTHYAPKGSLVLVGNGEAEVQLIQQQVEKDRAAGFRVGVLATEETVDHYRADAVVSCGQRNNLRTVAQGLYDALRDFDRQEIEKIYAETFPLEGVGIAVMNRLSKAAGGKWIHQNEG